MTAKRPIEEIVRDAAEAHLRRGAEYEAAGNADGAARLRAVSNLLYAILNDGTFVTILPPPESRPAALADGEEQDYRVRYEIDVMANAPQDAAQQAMEMMRDRAAQLPVLEVFKRYETEDMPEPIFLPAGEFDMEEIIAEAEEEAYERVRQIREELQKMGLEVMQFPAKGLLIAEIAKRTGIEGITVEELDHASEALADEKDLRRHGAQGLND
jgi:hypothetical protein